MGTRLYVDYCGEDHVLEPGDELVFGREAALCIDTNPYLHRRLGAFVFRDGMWWLDNLGSATVLTLADANSRTCTTIVPQSTSVVSFGEFTCTFVAGPHHYEIAGTLEDFEVHLDVGDGTEGERTLEWGVVPLNPDQHRLLVALCRERLEDRGGTAPLPGRREVARRLGWSLSKFNRKVDHLCLKLDRAGVRGLIGERGIPATDRRERLADHAVAVGLVTSADLEAVSGRPD